MNTKLLTLSVLLIAFCKVTAQNIYKTEGGHIKMMTLVNDNSVIAESHKLTLFLDYDSNVVKGILDLKTLSTRTTEINAVLQKQEDPLILQFSGTIPSQDFFSKRHDPADFNWPVTITYQGKSYNSKFNATITHVDQGLAMSCLFSARGQILVSDIGLDSLIEGLDKTIEVQFAQLVLKLE